MTVFPKDIQDLLAIHGGPKVRETPFPGRRQFGEEALAAVTGVFEDAWARGRDFGFQGEQEDAYTQAFADYQGGGFADAVNSGSAAIFAALAALDLEPGSEVVVSPVTDPGSVAPAILLGHRIVIADSGPSGFNTTPGEFERAVSDNTRACILTHLGGVPLDMEGILEIAKSRGIAVIEDCSQAHGAEWGGRKIGCFGDIGCFSTMFSKNHSSGGCGGLVFTQSENLYWRIRAVADRGKPFNDPDFQEKNPASFMFAALNLHQDELSCAIGRTTLAKLDSVIDRRIVIIERIDEAVSENCRAVHPVQQPPEAKPSPFFHTLGLDSKRLDQQKSTFTDALAAEGVDINPDYRFVVGEWPWVEKYLARPCPTPNAVQFRQSSFNVLFHENYSDGDVDDVINAIIKVDNALTDGSGGAGE